jgi:outer membrane protein assembly factor BamB
MAGRDHSPASEHAMKLRTIACLCLITFLTTLVTAQQSSTSTGPVRAVASGNEEWAQFAFDPDHVGYNPYETILSPTTVGNVVLTWSYAIPEGFPPGPPAVSGGVLYVGAENTSLQQYAVYALDAGTGNFIWKSRTAGPPQGSPAVAFGLGYVVAGNVYAFDANTGALAWQSHDSNCLYSPTLVSGTVYVVCDSNVVYALNAETGTPFWQYSTKGRINSSPAVDNGMLYVNSGDGNVYALNASTGAVIWQQQLGASLAPPTTLSGYAGDQAVSNGVLYLGVRNHFYALNASTGAKIWSSAFALGPYSAGVAPAIANGVVYVPVPEFGFLYALDAGTGAQLWRYQAYNSGALASPVVANGVVYVSSATGAFGHGTITIEAIDATTSELLWEHMSAGIAAIAAIPTPAVVNGMIYCSYASSTVTGEGAFGLPN